MRRFWLKPKVEEIWENEGIRGLLKIVGGMMGKYENAMLAARYQALETVSRRITRGALIGSTAERTAFALPGEKDSAPEPILFHDCAHVLSGYGTEPEAEVQVASFQRRLPAARPVLSCLSSSCCNSTWHPTTPITKARTGSFDPAKALIAIRRRAAMNVDLNNGWNYWPVMGSRSRNSEGGANILPSETSSNSATRQSSRECLHDKKN